MFKKGSRFITKRINEELDFKLHIILWNQIDELIENNKVKVDYLQVFELSRVDGGIKIIHRQEVPPYRNEIFININDINLPRNYIKIFVIDSGEYSTKMFADEY